jgi:hypothetical protein
MQHMEGSGTPVLYIGRTVLKGKYIWYNCSVLVAVRYTGRPLTQSDYTRCCINTVVLLRMGT